ALLARFGDRFSAAYQDEMPAERAVGDLPRIVRIADGESRRELRLDGGAAPNRLEFSAFSANQPLPLHLAVRILEDVGVTVLGERICTVKLASGDVWIQICGLETRGGAPVDAGATAERFEECFARVIAGDVDDDSFNAFVVIAGLGWRDI